ncbi:MAG: PepSY domain-containing protein [Cellulosilyticaceae bacterium]
MKKQFGLVVLMGMILLVGCTSRQPVPKTAQVPETVQNVEVPNAVSNQGNTMIDEERAKAVAIEQVPNGTIVEVSHDLNDLRPNYEFTIQEENYEYEIEVDAYTGVVTKIDQDFKIFDGSTTGNDKIISIDEVKAKEIALAQVPNGTVTKTSFDGDEYIPNYEIDIVADGYEYEFEVDARDGRILKMQKDLID